MFCTDLHAVSTINVRDLRPVLGILFVLWESQVFSLDKQCAHDAGKIMDLFLVALVALFLIQPQMGLNVTIWHHNNVVYVFRL